MNVEELLTRTLAAEADAREVDVPALHHRVMSRLAEEPPQRRRTPLLAAAAAVVLLGGGAALGVSLLGPDGDDVRLHSSESEGEVATEFDCPQVNVIDFRTTDDDGFLPDLSRGAGPADVARTERAPTYAFVVDGEVATLRLGDEDGSLGSITTYDRVDGRWEMRTAEVCSGSGDVPLAPTAGADELGRHGVDPWPARRFGLGGEVPAGFVDDRPYYNLAGVLEGHRSMWVEPCGDAAWCWVSGEPDSYLSTGRLRSSLEIGRPHVMSGLLVDPDLMVGRDNPLGLWAHDLTGPGTFSAVLRDGSRVDAVEISEPGWGDRRMLVVLAPADEVETLELVTADGTRTAWDPADLPDD
jgi:hypothetical protein